MRLYPLTAAERRIAIALATGETPAAIAARLGLSEYTIRTHIRSCLAKTGTARLSALVALLSRLAQTEASRKA